VAFVLLDGDRGLKRWRSRIMKKCNHLVAFTGGVTTFTSLREGRKAGAAFLRVLKLHRKRRRGALPPQLRCVECEHDSWRRTGLLHPYRLRITQTRGGRESHTASTRLSYPPPLHACPGTNPPTPDALGFAFVSRSSYYIVIVVLTRWWGWNGGMNHLLACAG